MDKSMAGTNRLMSTMPWPMIAPNAMDVRCQNPDCEAIKAGRPAYYLGWIIKHVGNSAAWRCPKCKTKTAVSVSHNGVNFQWLDSQALDILTT